nr:putative reverse transcriptase domain-containing protein [Tanacetum cinerariifolium]
MPFGLCNAPATFQRCMTAIFHDMVEDFMEVIRDDFSMFAKPVKLVREHLYLANANEINEKKPELKDLPNHLEYAYLHVDKSFPIIISSELSDKEKSLVLQVLENRKGAIAWKMSNIKGISPSYCTHKILMEVEFKPVIQPQRCLNQKVQDVVKNEIVKLLDSGLIYPISDSSWVAKEKRNDSKPKTRGVIVQETSEFRTTSSSQPSQLPRAKDKGKGIMVEPEKPFKKKDQMAFDEEVARKLEAQIKAEMEEEVRIAREKDEAKFLENLK